MFAYCTQALHLSEAEAYRRITVARAARKHPLLLTMLRDGRLHLSGIALLAPLLTPNNRDAVLARAVHRPKRELEELVPGLELVPGRVGTTASVSPAAPAAVEPLSPARYKVQFTASAELHDKLERLTALLRSQVPDVDLAAVIERAVTTRSSGSRPGASPEPTLPASRSARPTCRLRRATSLPLSAARCASATATGAATSTSRVDAAPGGTGSSSTTYTPSAWEGTTAPGTFACCAQHTTDTWPSTTTAR
jgi:hypothetical protein